jgi:hypothetical protein
MKSSMVIMTLTLASLRNFLDHVCAEAERELASINERVRREAFEGREFDDGAFDAPLCRLEIAARAVQYELVALVETELHRSAHEPWLRSTKHRGPKTLLDLNQIGPQSLSTLKRVSDLPFGKIQNLIEGYYGLTLSSLPKWAEVAALRESVNAFKHREGFRRFREIDWAQHPSWPQRHPTTAESAYARIDAVGTFLAGLHGELKRRAEERTERC